MRTDNDTQRSAVSGHASGDGTRASGLECGGPPPLSDSQSASGLAHSKTWRTAVAFGGLLSAFCFCAQAQTYSIDWHTIDGGGGTNPAVVPANLPTTFYRLHNP